MAAKGDSRGGRNPEGTRWSPASSLASWGLALVFLVGIDLGITRTQILWGPTAFENTANIRTVFPQTYRVLRKIYGPEDEVETRVALLGNSRLALSIEDQGVERALRELAPKRSIAAANLAIFGAYIGDTAILARHLDALDPDLIVLTVGGMELSRPANNPDARGPVSLLSIGWADGPTPPSDWIERADRWLRTLWPLYRFREFAREAILDRVLGRPDPGPAPSHFDSKYDLFVHLYGERADIVAAAHERFVAEQTLANFSAFVETVGPEHLKAQRRRVKSAAPVTRESSAIVALDQFLGELADSGRRVVVLLMPENPVLKLDTRRELHRPANLEASARLAKEIAARHGAVSIDARDWLPARVFLDFHHPLFEPEHFEELLAQEILNALDS